MEKYYRYNDEKHVTTCIMIDHPTLIEKVRKNNANILGLLTYNYDNKTEAAKFVGIAKCHPLDKMNKEIGEHIASSRADLAYHKAMAKDIESLRKAIAEEIAIIDKLDTHEQNMIAKAEKTLKKLTK